MQNESNAADFAGYHNNCLLANQVSKTSLHTVLHRLQAAATQSLLMQQTHMCGCLGCSS